MVPHLYQITSHICKSGVKLMLLLIPRAGLQTFSFLNALATCLAARQWLDVSLGEANVLEANFPRHELHLLLELPLSVRKQFANNCSCSRRKNSSVQYSCWQSIACSWNRMVAASVMPRRSYFHLQLWFDSCYWTNMLCYVIAIPKQRRKVDTGQIRIASD